MNKKGSMELSVNSIVILVIAIVMLGLILGFVRSKFSGLDKQLVQDEPEAQPANPSEPLTISRENIAVSPGEEVTLKIQVYNADSDEKSYTPAITCTNTAIIPDGNFKVSVKVIPAGETGKFLSTAKIGSGAPKGKHLCLLTAGSLSSKDVVIEVR